MSVVARSPVLGWALVVSGWLSLPLGVLFVEFGPTLKYAGAIATCRAAGMDFMAKENEQFRDERMPSRVSRYGQILYVVLPGAAYLVVLGRRLKAQRAQDEFRRGTSPYVLILRPFGVDSTDTGSRGFATGSPEQTLVKRLQRYGRVLAVGRPGEALPHLGASSRLLKK